ncbi:MAG TPA: hypothetical protein VGE52_04990, partial [Pirellulales bacterium]
PLADWLKEVAPLPPEERLAAVLAKLKECNPGFDGRAVQQRIDGGVVEFEITTDQVTDVSPIRALPELQKLALRGSNWSAGALADLAPLRSLRIVDLDVFSNKIVDLSPVASLPLRRLNCAGNPVTSLEPLRGMKLRDLDAQQCPELKSIAPLAGMPLAALNLSATKVSDIAPLRGMTTLTDLAFTLSPVRDATPLRGLPLTRLSTLNSQVTDLSPLRDVPLTWLHCDFVPERDAALLRSMKLLETINEKPAAEFWKEVDGGK